MSFAPFPFDVEAVTSVHDGDTATFRLTRDVGFGIHVTPDPSMSCRLSGIAARELAEAGGPDARDYLIGLLGDGRGFKVLSLRWDKYGGRYDGLVFDPGGWCVNDLLIVAGYAVAWSGSGVQPKPAWPLVPQPGWPVRTGP